jgi:ribosomal protein S18 acetylase RimI-like enzyme
MQTSETKTILCDYSNPAHRQAVSDLINVYIDDEMGGGNPLPATEAIRLVESLEKHPKSVVILAETAGVFSGLLVAFENFSTFTVRPMINIHDLIVRKEYRGQSVGRKLMDAVIGEAGRRQCSRITLEVRNDNLSAQKLYRSLGFEEAEPVHFYWRKYLPVT